MEKYRKKLIKRDKKNLIDNKAKRSPPVQKGKRNRSISKKVIYKGNKMHAPMDIDE